MLMTEIKLNLLLICFGNELVLESERVGKDVPELGQLEVGKFDSTVYLKTEKFLTFLKRLYNIRYQNALQEKEKLMAHLTDGEEKRVAFEMLKMKYQNNAVSNLVENKRDIKRVVEWDGELVQKIYPIYFNEHRPNHFLDFRDNFYIPSKYFAGQKFDTLYFNLSMIWLMTIFVYISWYYELLKKAVHGFAMRRRYGGKKAGG